MNFKYFVNEQVERLTAFEAFSRLPEKGRKEFTTLLFELAEETRPSRDRSAQDWMQEESARRVRAVIAECLEFQEAPTMAQIRSVWRRMYPPVSSVPRDCPQCHGNGFHGVEGPLGLSYARKCSHDGSERDSELKLSPAMTRHYLREQEAADKRRVEFMRRRANGELKGFERVTQDDVNALIAHLGMEL